MSAITDALLLLMYVIAVAVFVAFTWITFYIWQLHKKYEHIPGPPRDSFYLGNVPELKSRFDQGKSFVETLHDWSLEYGYTFVVFMIHQPLVCTIDPEGVKELLVTENFPKSKWNYELVHSLYGARFLGTGLVSDLNHETWSARRSLMNPAFSRKYDADLDWTPNLLKPMMGEFNSTSDVLMEDLSHVADGKTVVSLLDKLHRATLDVIGKVAYNMDIGSIHDDQSPFPRAIAKMFEGIREVARNPLEWLTPFSRRAFKQEVRDACLFMRKVAREKVAERKDAMRRGDHVPEDILSYIMKSQEAVGSHDEELIGDDFITFFVAGQETTANTLGFAFMELGRHPEIYAKLRQEIDEVLGERSYVEFTDLSQLQYCDLVIKETLRMYPPAGVTFREIPREGFQLSGYRIPKNSDVAASTFASSRHPDFHKDPLTFDPERFANDETKPTSYITYPFALGARNCIGQNFARMEAKVLLAKFVQRFDLKLDPNQSFDIQETTTLRPKGGTMATLTFRA